MTDYSNADEANLEIVENFAFNTFSAKGHQPLVELEYPEFQSLCPFSDRHDQGNLVVQYEPDEKILELKSLRQYLQLWRNKHNWQEFITEEIADTLNNAIEPKWLLVEIRWAARGGIFTTTTAERGE